jgi:hypothetical protein
LLFRTLGLCLALADPPAENRLQVLNDVWRVVSRLSDPGHYVSCAEVWMQFAVRHFSVCEREYGTKELLFLQAGILKHPFDSPSSVSYIHVSSVIITHIYNLAQNKLA